MIQGSEEWFSARCGKVTASRIADVMATIKSGEAASRRNYRMQLVVERLTGQPAESYTNGAMQRGIELEPEARRAYEFMADVSVAKVGFINHPTIPMSGASPDGLVGEDGLVEIKCPNTATHIDYMMAGAPPTNYLLQMQWQMECTGRKWCDFVSYDPRLPIDLQLFIVRVDRDVSLIEKIKAEVVKFLDEVSATVDTLNKRRA